MKIENGIPNSYWIHINLSEIFIETRSNNHMNKIIYKLGTLKSNKASIRDGESHGLRFVKEF